MSTVCIVFVIIYVNAVCLCPMSGAKLLVGVSVSVARRRERANENRNRDRQYDRGRGSLKGQSGRQWLSYLQTPWGKLHNQDHRG